MDWISSLQGLPIPIAILVVFALCLVWVIKSILKRVVDPLANSNKETAKIIKDGLDANTEAVKKATEHNEKIINNHVSHTEAIFHEVITEMRAMNNRRRADDDC